MNQIKYLDNAMNQLPTEIFDSLPVALFRISTDGIVKFINLEGQKLLGITNSDLVMKPIELILDKNSKEIFYDFLNRLKFERQTQPCLIDVCTSKDSIKKLSLYGKYLIHEENIQLIAIESSTDTESNYSYKKEFEDISNVAQVGRWELDLITEKLNWSNKIYEIFELNPADFQPSYETFLAVIHPEDRIHVNQAYSKSLIDKQEYEIEHRLIMGDGRIKWVRETCYSIFDPFEQPIKSIGTCQEITKQKELEIHLQESEKNYSNLVENTASLVWSLDEYGHFNFLNPAWEKSLGYSKEEMVNRPFSDFQPSDISIRDQKAFRKFSLDGEIAKMGYETSFLAKNGDRKY